jgi:hemerythrin-like domain-containing protein
MSQTSPSMNDPVRQLIDEHEIFMNALDGLAETLASIPGGSESIPAAALPAIVHAWESINEHLNVHFVKEEEIFFPYIERLFKGGRVKFQFLHIDHDRLREDFERFTILLQNHRVGHSSASGVDELRHLAGEMIELFYYHIVAEDTIYLDVAGLELTAEESAEVLDRMRRIESRLREDLSSL